MDPVPPVPDLLEDLLGDKVSAGAEGAACEASEASEVLVLPEKSVKSAVSNSIASASVSQRRNSRASDLTQQMQNLLGIDPQPASLRTIIKSLRLYIDYIAGVMVLLNSLVLIAELEVEGRSIAFEVGLPYGEDLRDYLPTLRRIDAAFVLVFLVELLCRLGFERLNFCLELCAGGGGGVNFRRLEDLNPPEHPTKSPKLANPKLQNPRTPNPKT